MKKIYEKYNVNNYAELLQHFEMITLTPLEDLEVDDETLYHSFGFIIEKSRESKYNPIEESIMLKSTFLASFYGIPYEEFTEIVRTIGSFRTHILFTEVLKENEFYIGYYNLFLNNLSRLNNIGIILVEEGKGIIEKVEEFLSGLSVEKIQGALEEFTKRAEELGIFEELGEEEKINN